MSHPVTLSRLHIAETAKPDPESSRAQAQRTKRYKPCNLEQAACLQLGLMTSQAAGPAIKGTCVTPTWKLSRPPVRTPPPSTAPACRAFAPPRLSIRVPDQG